MLNPTKDFKGHDFKGLIFEGIVVDNNDPLKEERCRIRILGIHDDVQDSVIPWARPIKQRTQGSTSGVQSFGVPTVGSVLYVTLQGGDMLSPMYIGGVVNALTKAVVADTNYPHRYGFKDAKGNIFYVDTTTGDVDFLHFSGTSFHISPAGALVVHTQSNASFDVVGNLTATVSGDTTVTTTGTTLVKSTGNTTVEAPIIDLKGASGATKGIVQGDCVCAFTGFPHAQISNTVKAAL